LGSKKCSDKDMRRGGGAMTQLSDRGGQRFER
jgi:hypothetical protein